MILDEIFNKTKQELELLKQEISFEELLNQANELKKQRANKSLPSFKNALKQGFSTKIIAEVKKASPSKGIIREDFNPVEIAKEYEKNNASCLSVLSEPYFFKGSLEYLNQISKNCNLPLLRKDFIFDKYQILQAYINNASAILLIAKMLDNDLAKELFEYAKSWGLDVLFEVHNKQELDDAFYCNADIIGINHRNLNDFSIDLELCNLLVPIIKKHKNSDNILVVAESGIQDTQTIKNLKAIGVDAFLIGEFFMKQARVGDKLKEFSLV